MQKIVKRVWKSSFQLGLCFLLVVSIWSGIRIQLIEVAAVDDPIAVEEITENHALLSSELQYGDPGVEITEFGDPIRKPQLSMTDNLVSLAVIEPLFEIEPNNEFYNANRLVLEEGEFNEAIIGYINDTRFDKDIYRFVINQESTLDLLGFWAGNYYQQGLEDDLRIYIVAGNQVITDASLISLDDGSETRSLSMTLKKSDNYYYLVVMQNSTDAVKYVGEPYALIIEINDITPPVITLANYTTLPTNQPITVVATTNEGTMNAYSHVFTENGTFDFVATDAGGNITTKTVTITNIDKIPPTITIGTYPTDPIKADILVTATCNEGTMNADSHNFTDNGSFVFVATDAAGNTTTQTVTITNIVRMAPFVTGVENNGIYNTDRTLQFTEGTVKLDGISVNSGVVVSAEGVHVILATDSIGYTGTTVFTIDRTPPIISITPYSTVPTMRDIDVYATVNEGTLKQNYYTFQNNGSFTFTATDLAGNVANKEVTITNIDRIDPIITILPYKTDLSNEDITVYATTNKGTLNYSSHTFTENGSFTFYATNTASNQSMKTVEIKNICKECLDYQPAYRTHVQNIGWQDYVKGTGVSGTENQGLRLEAINIKVLNSGSHADLGIKYSTHVQNIGWMPFVADDAMSGTENRGLRLEAIKIELTGLDADKYDVFYRVHVQNYGWLDFAENGRPAGSEGFGYRLEAIDITILKKGALIGLPTARAFISSQGNQAVNYRTHVQNVGWQGFVGDGVTSGTTGKSLRLEGIEVKLGSGLPSGSILYSTHVQDIGWMDFVSDGVMSGTSGKAKRLEAIKIKLTGDIATKYDIYYRVHAENFGWLGWAENGEPAGTANFAYRLEGIEIALIHKGAAAPGITYLPFVQKE